jgi:hypothetical protein
MDWLARMRDRQRTMASEVEGYYSAITCHLAALAYARKARVEWDKAWDLPA